MKLSVIVISFNMQREIPRTLQSLTRQYQEGCEELDYEVLVIDNGSPQPIDPNRVRGLLVPNYLPGGVSALIRSQHNP